MDAVSFENLRSFFDRVKNAGFFERLLFWRSFVSASHDAYSEYQQLISSLQVQDQKNRELLEQYRSVARDLENLRVQSVQFQQDLASERALIKVISDRIAEKERECATLAEAQANSGKEILRLKEELVALGSRNEELLRRIGEKENEIGGLAVADKKNRELVQKMSSEVTLLTTKADQMNQLYAESKETIAKLRQADEERVREHDARVTELSALKRQLDDDRLRLQAERDEEVRRQYEEMEQTWRLHEEEVEQTLRSICQRHTLQYCDKEKFPYAGKPDNTVIIFDQFVIFDAKSPKNSDELRSFPQYVRTQAEAAKKYLKGPDVRKEIFLVVPANTVEYLDDFYYDLADLQVYVVTHDCLEPIVLALRKIEDYEFAEKLSPDDRENICRVIGKFAHATKRRIQIDNYFCNTFIDLLQSCDLLPDEIREKVQEIEVAEKMNPPIEKRKKKIPIGDLEREVKKTGKGAESQEIDVTAVTKDKIENMPLHKFLE